MYLSLWARVTFTKCEETIYNYPKELISLQWLLWHRHGNIKSSEHVVTSGLNLHIIHARTARLREPCSLHQAPSTKTKRIAVLVRMRTEIHGTQRAPQHRAPFGIFVTELLDFWVRETRGNRRRDNSSARRELCRENGNRRWSSDQLSEEELSAVCIGGHSRESLAPRGEPYRVSKQSLPRLLLRFMRHAIYARTAIMRARTHLLRKHRPARPLSAYYRDQFARINRRFCKHFSGYSKFKRSRLIIGPGSLRHAAASVRLPIRFARTARRRFNGETGTREESVEWSRYTLFLDSNAHE